MKQLVLVAAHFPPGNLASVHRARLWAQHLQEFGWAPTILTTHYRHYEEALDWDLQRLTSPELPVIRTAALPVRPFRVVGDIGIRGFPFHYRALSQLARRGAIDFLHITIPPFYSALLGRLIHRRYGVAFGIDYIDPWVHAWPGANRTLSKGWASLRLAQALEPWAVRDAALITGVAPEYARPMLDRHPEVRARAVVAAMPYGGSELDMDWLRQHPRAPFLFEPGDGACHVIYAGAMLPNAYTVLERLFEAIVRLRGEHPAVAARLRLHFVGTGRSPDDPEGHNIRPYIERFGLAGLVDEQPARIPYLDVLNHLQHASATLILGSTERHYTPSKAFQAVQARRPILAILHEASTAAAFLRQARAGQVVTFPDGGLPTLAGLVDALHTLIAGPVTPPDVDWTAIDQYSARASARALASALDEAFERHNRRKVV